MRIIKAFEARIEAEQILGTLEWIREWDYKEMNKLREFILENEERIERTFSKKQKTIAYFIGHLFTYVTNVLEHKIDFSKLGDEGIQELMTYYRLDKPEERYKEIKADINGPESFMTSIPYRVIYELYQRKKVPFDRQIFVGCLTRFNAWHGGQYKKELSETAKAKLTTIFPTDEFSLDILMAVFEMELGVNTAFYLSKEYNIGGVIIALVDLKILDKEKIQLKIFEAFNNPSLKQTTHAWARNVHRDLEFSLEELMPHQDKLINLLENDRNLLAVYGLQVLKKLSKSPDFNWRLFIDKLEGIVFREKFNSGFNLALGILQKLLKDQPNLGQKVCINLAPIFLQPDHKVQLKAKNIFVLTPPDLAIITALEPYVASMHSEVKKELAAFISQEHQEELATEVYEEVAFKYASLDEVDELKYITEEIDFIFQCSKVLKSQDPIEAELFLEALPRFYDLKTNKALKPALKQASRAIHFTNKMGPHQLMLAKLIRVWLDPSEASFKEELENLEKILKKERDHYSASLWMTFFKMISQVVYTAERFGKDVEKLPLLSTATHTNGQIHPAVFLDRLMAYETANSLPDEGDFNRALCRINRWTKFKQTAVSKNNKSEYRKILAYLLDGKKAFDSDEIQDLETSWLTAFSLKNPTKAIDATLAFQVDEQWWKPEKKMSWNAGRKYSEIDNYSWATIDFNLVGFEEYLEKDCFFGYSLVHKYLGVSDIPFWFFRDMFQTETLFLNTAIGNFSFLELYADNAKVVLNMINYANGNLKPIYEAGHIFLVISMFCQDRSCRAAALDWLCQLIENKLLNLTHFINAVIELLASPKHPVPIGRVTEQFNELISLHGTYENVAYQTLKELIPAVDIDNLPKGFSKVLNHFYEVYQNSPEPLSKEMSNQLKAMTKVKTVKKVAEKILEG